MRKQIVIFRDLGEMDYKNAWDYQESLLKKNLDVKMRYLSRESGVGSQESGAESRESGVWSRESGVGSQELGAGSREVGVKSSDNRLSTEDYRLQTSEFEFTTQHYLLFVEHPPVFTLGKSGKEENVLINDEERIANGIEFFRTNRGGDITFHGRQQIVGYPILDLERFYTDIGRYLRDLEEVIILTLADYEIKGDRSKGETGVWIQPGIPGRERKICAMGVRCSRWLTMHGFAFNVNTDLSYFSHIIPCGIQNKQVTSLEKELGYKLNFNEVKEKVKRNFEKVFNVELITENDQ